MKKIALLSVFVCAPALAHIEMQFPTPRFNDGQNKWCPCGGGGDGTRANADCDIDTSDRLERGSTSTTFTSGDTITVSWRETVAHSGRMRVAFDASGSDLSDFNANILADLSDPAGNTGNAGDGNLWEVDVTLPDVSCTDCTLQVIQVMNNNTTDEVPDPSGFQTYFQCANIVLEGGDPAVDDDDDRPPPPDINSCSTGGAMMPMWIALLLLFVLPAPRHFRA
jgi:hypothetical protein